MPLYEFQGKRTDKIDNTIGNTQRASSLNTTTNILNLSAQLVARRNTLQLGEKGLRERSEASHDIATNQLGRLVNVTLLGDLDLQLAATESKVKDLLNAGDFTGGQGSIVFGDLVAAGDTDINAALADEGGDVGGGQEDQGNWEVLDEGDI